jgi:hypothetical protein
MKKIILKILESKTKDNHPKTSINKTTQETEIKD